MIKFVKVNPKYSKTYATVAGAEAVAAKIVGDSDTINATVLIVVVDCGDKPKRFAPVFRLHQDCVWASVGLADKGFVTI